MDGTLIEAAASLKSFRPKEGAPPPTDPEVRLLRKEPGQEARLAFLGHALTGTATAC